jgi:hypothetical protein
MTTDENAKKLADWFEASVKEKIQTDVAEYAKRGRKYAAAETVDLQTRYIEGVRNYCAQEKPDAGEAEWMDIHSELVLRGADIPNETFTKDLDVLTRRAKQALRDLREEPGGARLLFETIMKDRGRGH